MAVDIDCKALDTHQPYLRACSEGTEIDQSSRFRLFTLLTKPGTPCHSDYQEYRQKYLQWRSGSACGARGEVTDLNPLGQAGSTGPARAALQAGAEEYGQASMLDEQRQTLVRSSSWPLFPLPATPSPRKLWLLSPDLETDLRKVSPQVWEWLQSQAGYLLLMVVLILVVFTYAACPLTVSWAKVVGIDVAGVPIKGRPFKESSVIVVSWAMIATVGLALSAITGGRPVVRQCLDRRAIFRFAPAGVGWALADVCEVLAVARIDPATYGVISQARLLGSAAAGLAIRGVRQTRLQWGVLCSLSMVCMAYCLLTDDPVQNHHRLFRWRLARTEVRMDWSMQPILEEIPGHHGAQEFAHGVALALGKVTLSVLSGVYGESQFKSEGDEGAAPPELHVQMTQISFSAAFAAGLGYCALCILHGESILEFFHGPDGSWDARVWVVAMVYCWREWICNLCVKRFDSLVKNICNAVALVVTYGFTVLVTREKPFSSLKVLLLLAVVGEVVNYVATRRGGSAAAPSAAEEAATAAAAASVGSIPVAEYQTGQVSLELKGLKGL